MDRCPLEVIGTILDHADTSTLKALRLVNRTMSQLATPVLFQEVYLGYLQNSFTKLRFITGSRLAKHVRSMVYIIDLLPDLRDQDTWWNRVSNIYALPDLQIGGITSISVTDNGAVDGTDSEIDKTEAEKAECWNLYQCYYSEQQYLLDHNADQTMLAAAFALLPNFEKIEIRTTVAPRAGEHQEMCHPFWTRVLNETLYPPGYLDERDWDNSEGGKLCKNTLMALSWNAARLKEIDTWMIGGKNGILAHPDGVPWPLMTAAFIHLQRLNLKVEYNTDNHPDSSEMSRRMSVAASSMIQWVCAAKSLEVLKLRFLDDFDIFRAHPDTLKDLVSMQWPKLRRLVLDRFHTTEDTLFSIINQQPSLKHLELSRINLNLRGDEETSGLWLSFFRRLAATKGLSLKSVKLASLVDEQYLYESLLPRSKTAHARLQQYILSGGNVSGVYRFGTSAEPIDPHGSLFGDYCDICGERCIDDFGTCLAQRLPPNANGSPVWHPKGTVAGFS